MTPEQVEVRELKRKMTMMYKHLVLLEKDVQRLKRARLNQVGHRRQSPIVHDKRPIYRPRGQYNVCVLSPLFSLLDSSIKLVFRAIERIIRWIITRIFR